MKNVWVFLFFMSAVFVQADIQKMILSANIKTEDAAKDLYKLEKFFQENEIASSLQSKYQLQTQMELLDTYVTVTIKPIDNVLVKNKLLYLLREHFPQSFVVDDTPVVEPRESPPVVEAEEKIKSIQETKIEEEKIEQTPTVVTQHKKSELSIYKKIQDVWGQLDGEWVALMFLALAGFLLVYRSTKQISKIKALQKEVEVYQNKIEGDMEDMGEKR